MDEIVKYLNDLTERDVPMAWFRDGDYMTIYIDENSIVAKKEHTPCMFGSDSAWVKIATVRNGRYYCALKRKYYNLQTHPFAEVLRDTVLLFKIKLAENE